MYRMLFTIFLKKEKNSCCSFPWFIYFKFHIIFPLGLTLSLTMWYTKVPSSFPSYYLSLKWSAESKASITPLQHEINLEMLNA